MERYSEYAPTGFDSKGLALEDRQDWFVLIGRNRDSGIRAQSNWAAALKMLRKGSRAYEVHRFGHWACGWLEIVIVKPGTKAELIGLEIEKALENYPILDEHDHSEREWEVIASNWAQADLAQRLKWIRGHSVSRFAIRRSEVPQGLHYEDHIIDEAQR